MSHARAFVSASQLVTLQEAKLLLNEDDYLLKSVYDYWVRKRKNCRGPSLIPQIRQEKRDGSTNNDAYVAFRRRTEKMQTRKVTFSRGAETRRVQGKKSLNVYSFRHTNSYL